MKNRKKQRSNSLFYGYYFIIVVIITTAIVCSQWHAHALAHTDLFACAICRTGKNVTHMLFFGEVFPVFTKSITVKPP